MIIPWHIAMSNAAASRFLILVFLLALHFAFSPCSAAANEFSDFKNARDVAAAGNLLEAQSLLRDIIDKYPTAENELEVRYLLGQILYRRADYTGAVDEFTEILRKHPAWEYAGKTAYSLAMAQIGMVDYGGASNTLETMLASYPESGYTPDAAYWLAESLYRRGDYAKSLDRFSHFLDEYSDHPLREHAMDSWAWCLEQLGKFDEAIVARELFIGEYPDSPMVEASEFNLAADYYKTGNKIKAAERYLSLASAQSAIGKRSLLKAGLTLAETNQAREAIEVLKDEVLKELPTGEMMNDEMRLGMAALANCLLKTDNFEAAEYILQSLLDMTEGKPIPCGVSFQLALAQAGQGKLAEAAGRLSTIPRHADCSHLYDDSALATAALLLNLNQPILAAEQLESFLEARPSSESLDKLSIILAISHLRARQYEKAHTLMERLIADEGEIDRWPQAIYYDGLSRFRTGQYLQAAKRFRQFADKGKPIELVPLANYLEAASVLRAGKFVDAGQRYEAFYEQWPDTPLSVAALYRAGLASMINSEYEKAISLLEALNRKHAPAPEAVSGRYFLGVALMKTSDLEGAAEVFRFLLKNDPGFELASRAHFEVGMIEFALGRYDSAANVLGNPPPEFDTTGLADSATFFAAAARYKMGRYESASAGFRGLPSLFPDSPLAIQSSLWAGMCEEKLGRPREAITLYEEAGRQTEHPDAGKEAMYALAWTELGLANGEKARAAFKWLTEESSQIQFAEQAYFWEGRLNYAESRWEEAMESLLQLKRLYPHSQLADSALFFAARSTRKSSDYNGAIQLFEKLVKEYPESEFIEQAEIESAECMIEAGKAGAAALKFEQFIQNNLDSPLRPLALYDMGRALQRTGEFEDAIEQYKAAAGGETTELAARCRFAIAECLAELDRGGEATAELIGIARGGFPIGWAARARLQVARLLERDSRIDEARQIYTTVAVEYADDAAGMVALKAVKRIDSDTLITAER